MCVDGQLLTRRDKVRYGLPRTVGGADCIGRPGEWTRQLRYDPPAGEEGWSTAAAAAPSPPLPQQPCPTGVRPFTKALSEKRVAKRAL